MIRASLRKLSMPPDTFERHFLVASLAGTPKTALDVGGIRGELGLFLPGTNITTINLDGERADVHFDGDTLSFANNSFEIAVSLDVLEHIPRAARSRHFEELTRVASKKAIICCPFGSPEHERAEQSLSDWYRGVTGDVHRFLGEHLELGLPNEAEVRHLAADQGLPYRVRFHGDFRKANQAFEASTRLRCRPSVGSVSGYARVRLDPRRDLTLDDRSHRFTNRVFIEIDTHQEQSPA